MKILTVAGEFSDEPSHVTEVVGHADIALFVTPTSWDKLVTFAPVSYASTPRDVPLSEPLYGATFGQAFTRFWRKWATFSGRASRSEFWWSMLAYYMGLAVASAIMIIGGYMTPATGPATNASRSVIAVGLVLVAVWFIATVIPFMALACRRLHDTNQSAALALVIVMPLLGLGLFLLIACAFPSKPAGIRFDK